MPEPHLPLDTPPMDAQDRTRFVEALLPVLRAALGGVEVREMLDATGLYLDGVLFGLISGGLLHFRVDQYNRADYDAWEDGEEARDMFSHGFPTGGLKYRVVPGFVLGDEDKLAAWGRKAWEAALRARKADSH